MSQIITARRGAESKDFTRATWDLLPADKYGWKQTVEVPDEVKELQRKKEEITATDADYQTPKGRKGRSEKQDADDHQ